MSKQDTGRTSITQGGEQARQAGHAEHARWRAGRHAEPLGGEQAGTPSRSVVSRPGTPSPLSCVDDTRGTGGRRRNEGTGSG